MEIVDNGYLITASYPFQGHERYDLNNGNSYLSKAMHVSFGVNQGAVIKIYNSKNALLADWGNVPLVEVTKFKAS